MREQLHGLGHAGRVVGKASLGVDVERHLDRRGKGPHVSQQLIAGHVLVGAPERRGVARAGRGQGEETHRLEDPRRADVPWVGHDEQGATVQLAKPLAPIHGSQYPAPELVATA